MHGWVNEDSCKPSAVDFSRQVQYVTDAFAHVYTVYLLLAAQTSCKWIPKHDTKIIQHRHQLIDK